MTVIDRLEADLAVIEYDGRVFNVPRTLLPQDAKEGDVLKFTVEVDRAATEARRSRVRSLEDRLFRK